MLINDMTTITIQQSYGLRMYTHTPTHIHNHITYTRMKKTHKESVQFLAINQENWQPCCTASPGVLISQPASVTTASALMSSALPWGRGRGGAGEQ